MNTGDEQSFLDRLQADRLEGRYARMLPKNVPLNEKAIATAVAEIQEWMRIRNISIGDLAHQLGVGFSRPTLTQLLNGKYTGEVEAKVRRILVHMDNFEASSNRIEPTFIDSPIVVQRMMRTIRLAHGDAVIAVIVGPAGCSKTSCMKAAHREIPASVYVRCLKPARSMSAFVNLLLKSLGKGITQTTTLGKLMEIIEILKGSGRLLLIDEAQHLSKEALEVVRDIHDEAEIAIVLAGTMHLYGSIDDTDKGSQFYSRASSICNLGDLLLPEEGPQGQRRSRVMYTVEDVIRICGAGRLRFTGDAIEMLYTLANTPSMGAMRTCQRPVRNVARVPGITEREISADDLWGAMREIKSASYQEISETRVANAAQTLPPVRTASA